MRLLMQSWNFQKLKKRAKCVIGWIIDKHWVRLSLFSWRRKKHVERENGPSWISSTLARTVGIYLCRFPSRFIRRTHGHIQRLCSEVKFYNKRSNVDNIVLLAITCGPTVVHKRNDTVVTSNKGQSIFISSHFCNFWQVVSNKGLLPTWNKGNNLSNKKFIQCNWNSSVKKNGPL